MASSSSGGRCNYDVFISFRGEDTRKIFVGHLYRALQQKAINTFIDSEGLSKGNKISELLEAIGNSRLSIVVLSQNYASSTWCLKELAKILDCMVTEKQIVVPIFYQVDPSDLRKINGKFAEAFAKHGENSNLDKEELECWRSALIRVADLSGWDSTKYEDDGRLIEEIVENTFKKLIHTSSNKANGLVGMDSHITEMNSRLCLQVNDVRVVGIWGMGGIGKTTIARAVFDEIAWQFEHSCFVDNVKEAFINKREVQMQEELISILLKEKVRSLGLNRGWNMIKERLGMKKVFVVLDDVETFSQIEALLGKPHAFGEGSRVIVTTRNKQSLSGVNETYKPAYLSNDEALELFVKYAFRTNQPNGDYDHLSRCAMEYAQGLPLALKVLGAFLDNKSVCEWEAVLVKLKKTPQIELQDVLRTSFDELDDSEKDIFLDIACLFRGWSKSSVTELLDSFGFFPHNGLRVLIDRALITISRFDQVDMHDLIQEMGREIVRLESTKEPGKRSRLWSSEDANCVLTQKTATDAVECLVLKLSNSKVDLCIDTEAFVRMTKLRLLIIYYSTPAALNFAYCWTHKCICPVGGSKQLMKGDFEFLSHELRCLLWHGCPLKSLPSTYIPKNLVKLDMRGSHIRELWEGIKPLQNLKVITLSHSQYLVKIPDLTEAVNLEKLLLNDCSSLLEVHPSISALQNLDFLNLKRCKGLNNLPSSIRMKSLKTLDIIGCSNLQKFPEISQVMNKLTDLCLDGTAIKELPSSISNLTGLVTLDLRRCREFKSLPGSIHMKSLKTLNLSGCSNVEKFPEIPDVMKELTDLYLDGTAIKELPSSISNLTGLVTLDLSGCREFKSLPGSIHMKSLKTLNLSGCSNVEKFPEIPEVMTELKEVYLDETAIKELPSSISNLTGLVTLDLSGCREFKSLPGSIHMKSLKTLNLSGCSNVEKFPEIPDVMKELTGLYLDGTAIKELPSSISNLTGLVTLDLSGCREFKSLPGSIHMKSLKTLNLSGCSNVEKFPEIPDVMKELTDLYLDGTAIKELPSSISNLTGLVTLDLSGCREFKSLPGSIHMKSLKTLNLSGCSNVEKFPEIPEVMTELKEVYLDETAIKELPSSISNLTGLVTLDLSGCREFKSLPGSIHMKSLKTLNLSGCSNVEKFPEIPDVMKELTGLYLDGTAIKELPSSISNLTGLVTLDLSGCREFKSLPGSIHMKSLKTLNLSGCSNVEKFPEIPDVMKELTDLYLDGTAIKELPSSISNLTGLVTLDLSGCREFKSLPGSIHMKSLKTLNLSGCSNVEKFPEIPEVMTELKEVYLDETAIKELPSSISNLTGLVTLDLSGCREFKSLPGSIHMKSLKTLNLSGCSNVEKFPEIPDVMKELTGLYLDGTAIKELPSSISNLTGLVTLDLSGCREFKSLPGSIHMKSLKTLNLSGCSNVEKFPEIPDVMKELTDLYLDGTAIKELPSSISNLTGLVTLDLSGCREFKSLPGSIHMKSLKTLNLSGCSNVEKFPEIPEVMTELKEVYLDETAIKELPSSIERLMGIKILSMRNCKSIEFLPDSICNLADLTHLNLSGCSVLHNLPEKLGDSESLQVLDVSYSGINCLPFPILYVGDTLSCIGCKEMTAPLPALPSSMEEFWSYSVLLHLDLSDCSLSELSDGIADLSSLKTLKLCRNNLESLPVTINRLGCLTHLELEACKRLKSIPELSSSINYIDAHDCIALETVSKPKPQYQTDHFFTFSNCLQLVQTNLFTDIVERHSHLQGSRSYLGPLQLNMSLPGSEVPDWFTHQSRGVSVSAQLPPNWFDSKFLGFAICAVLKCQGINYHTDTLSAACLCIFNGNSGECSFSFDMLDSVFRINRNFRSDHMFLGYVSWSDHKVLIEEGKLAHEAYNEATFQIVLSEFVNTKLRVRSCGVRLVYANPDEMLNLNMPQPQVHVDKKKNRKRRRQSIWRWGDIEFGQPRWCQIHKMMAKKRKI